MDYKDTLLMNKSNFEMRGNLANKEPALVEQWKAKKLYEEITDFNDCLRDDNRRICTKNRNW